MGTLFPAFCRFKMFKICGEQSNVFAALTEQCELVYSVVKHVIRLSLWFGLRCEMTVPSVQFDLSFG